MGTKLSGCYQRHVVRKRAKWDGFGIGSGRVSMSKSVLSYSRDLHPSELDSERIQWGVEGGVYFYLARLKDPGLLRSIIRSAVRTSRAIRRLAKKINDFEDTIRLLQDGRFLIRTPAEADARPEWSRCGVGQRLPRHGVRGARQHGSDQAPESRSVGTSAMDVRFAGIWGKIEKRSGKPPPSSLRRQDVREKAR